MRNARSVDVEDWFQVGAFEHAIARVDWNSLDARVERNTDAVLSLFAESGVKGSFFTLGRVAKRYPALIRRIVDRMYFALMADARTQGCTRFDFGRSKAGTGTAAFKKNRGFQGATLMYVKSVAFGGASREINPLYPRYRLQIEAWKRLPLWVANQVGPLISKGLG